MNIDIEKAQKEFIEYTSKFNTKNENIDRKIWHSIRVKEISKQIATKIELSQEQIELATLIGLLHDIGRFEQYDTIGLGDCIEGFDHGDYGVEVLNRDIRKYIDTDKYDEIIKKAVKNHNKFGIEEGLTSEELLFSKIVRDADKTDILYEEIDIYFKGIENQVNRSVLNEKVYNQFKNKSTIKKEEGLKLENIDNIATAIAFIFDINFKETFEIIKENDYINKIVDRYNFEDKETKEKIEEIRKIANEYIKQKIEDGN